MNRLKNPFIALVLSLLLVVGIGRAVYEVQHPSRTASALSQQHVVTFSGSINAETTIISGATQTNLHVYSMEIASSVSGTVVLRNGTGGAVVANLYLIANTPRDITNVWGGNGLALTQNILTATLAGSTLTLTARSADQ